ncbi:MAG: helix-turn-helix transcriptional regulator [Oligoflexia bacterium]|nr:helix-turn-helix transcriptional regulator [Oligoflexia bacterium]
METFGDRLKRLRVSKGSSISDVSNHIFVSPSTYRDWENGREIKGEPYIKVAEYFNVSLNYLLTGQELKIEEALNEVEKHIRIIRSFL